MNAVTAIRPSPASVDLARAGASIAFAAAQPIISNLARFTSKGETIADRSHVRQGPTTPVDGAFAIWGPIFLASLNFAVQSASPERRDDPLLRKVGWLTSAAYAGNSAWALQTQYRGLGWPSVGIIAATAASASTALVLAERSPEDSDSRRLAAYSVAPLAGWLTLATFANLEETLNETRGRPEPEEETRRSAALIGAAATTAAAITAASRGNPLYVGAVAWGLGGIALRNVRDRNRTVVSAALLGLAAVAAVAGAALWARRD